MATAEQRARAVTNRDAALEHVTGARELYDLGRWVLASYISGLEVESMLRAYRHMIDPQFDSRHEIDRLYKLARLADVVPAKDVEVISAALGDVVSLWSNDHRFLSEAALKARWRKRRVYPELKGDFMKARVRKLVNSASQIVAMGAARWMHSFKK